MLTNVLVVEDEPIVAESIRARLEEAAMHAVIAGTIDEARQFMSTIQPDLILVKWILHGQSASIFVRQLRLDVRTRTIPLVLLGPSEDEKRRIDEMISVADGCVERSAQREEIVDRIGTVLRARRVPCLAGGEVTKGNLCVDLANEKVYLRRYDKLIELRVGRAERCLLYLLISSPGRVFSRARLLQQLWGDREIRNERLVDSYVKRLRSSLRLVGCTHMIESVRGFGYKFVLESSTRTPR
jgi:two-component system, OmpR family, phosphate regulon response regulator PhoB